MAYSLQQKDHTNVIPQQERNTIDSAETTTTYKGYLLLQCFLKCWSLHCSPYLRENAHRNGFLGQILQDTMLVETTDRSMERHFFSGCSSLPNKVVKLQPHKFDWFWTITIPICKLRLCFMPKIIRSNLRLIYRTKCSLYMFFYMGR